MNTDAASVTEGLKNRELMCVSIYQKGNNAVAFHATAAQLTSSFLFLTAQCGAQGIHLFSSAGNNKHSTM